MSETYKYEAVKCVDKSRGERIGNKIIKGLLEVIGLKEAKIAAETKCGGKDRYELEDQPSFGKTYVEGWKRCGNVIFSYKCIEES